MNSSGIKRGLAGSAVAALAVTGLPFLATSANAAVGDVLQVGSVGPTLNGGDLGGVVVLKSKNITEAEAEGGDLTLVNSGLNGSPNSASQTVSIVGTPVFAANAGDSNPADGFDEITVHVAATTPNAGETASYAVFLDDDADGAVDAAEARTQVSQTTSGALASIVVAPTSQSVAQGQSSGAYAVTLKDAAGRTTQLAMGEDVAVTSDADVTPSDASLTASELELGTGSFTASSAGAATLGAHTITLDASTTPDVKTTATLNVTKAAVVTAPEVDIVTGADSWNGFGGGTAGGVTSVRVDQGSIRIDFKGDDKNSTVTLNLTGHGVTFGGKTTATVSTVLDANGVGSVTITPDAGTVQESDWIDVAGSFVQELDFERAYVDSVESADRYFSALKGSVDVTATVLDQFGLPVSTGFVEAYRNGVNADATPQRKAVGADGKVTFTFTDAKAVNGDVETVSFDYYPDQFANSPTQWGSTEIKYTTDGMGSNYTTYLAGTNTEGATYKPSDVSVLPLSDADADSGDEVAALQITGGEAGAEVTVSVDNGALILEPGESLLSEGSSSVTTTVTGGGALPAGYQIIGTKSGVTTVTISSAHRTETAQFTVAPQADLSAARNITVSGPATVPSGADQIIFTAVVTDAFGNPIANFPRELITPLINVTVTGPGQFQDGDVQTNANGELKLNVKLDADAAGDVTIKVEGLATTPFVGGTQFGAAEDRLSAQSTTDDGEGLSASHNVATATTTVEAPSGPVKVDAQLVVVASSAGNKDKVKGNAVDEAAGATATLWRGGKKVDTASLNDSGDVVFKVKDTNGKKKTTYTVKISGTALSMKDSASDSTK